MSERAFPPNIDSLHGEKFTYVCRVRWWQFWRWTEVRSEDYIISRAAEVILDRRYVREYARLAAEHAKFVEENRRDQAQ